jgi:hypothetical protein
MLVRGLVGEVVIAATDCGEGSRIRDVLPLLGSVVRGWVCVFPAFLSMAGNIPLCAVEYGWVYACRVSSKLKQFSYYFSAARVYRHLQ